METAIRRGEGVAVWRQLAETLRREIGEGPLGPGTRLPTEVELAARFGVNRHTARRSLAALREEGLIRIEQGRGTFVAERQVNYTVTPHTRFRDNLLRQFMQPGKRRLGSRYVRAYRDVARALDLPVGSELLEVESVGYADGRPISVGTQWFEAARFPGLDASLAETMSVTESLRRYGVEEYFRKQSRVTARLPSQRDATLLEQPASRPILWVENLNVDVKGRPLEYANVRMASDRVQVVIEPNLTMYMPPSDHASNGDETTT